MRRALLLIFLFATLFSACTQDENDGKRFNGSETDTPLSIDEIVKDIERNPDEYLSPYNGFSYDAIVVNVEGKRIVVKAKSKDVLGEDVYVFVYENGSLALKSYLLEAIPLSVRERAVSVALGNETIYENAKGYVTVRRVLPHTAAKFYLPKELFSVTWHGERVVSALIDLDEGRVVGVYVSE